MHGATIKIITIYKCIDNKIRVKINILHIFCMEGDVESHRKEITVTEDSDSNM
jgi:hypothetical protein